MKKVSIFIASIILSIGLFFLVPKDVFAAFSDQNFTIEADKFITTPIRFDKLPCIIIIMTFYCITASIYHQLPFRSIITVFLNIP